MPKVSVIVVVYDSMKFLPPVLAGIASQTHGDLETFAVINSSTDGSAEYIRQNFPFVKMIEPGRNTGFAGGNNLAIRQSSGEFLQLVNPDLIMEPEYVQTMLGAFTDPKVAAATGKLLRYDFPHDLKTNIIDSTGITMSSSGRAKDRGQGQADQGQFDHHRDVFAVTGAAPMYRRSALEAVKFEDEYYDEDFLAYWEDVDLSWRLNRAGFKNVYVPEAVAYHGRAAGQSKGGYLHILNFIRHHRRLPAHIRRLNYRNHILMYLKNAERIHPTFILREIAMLVYITVFETGTLAAIPDIRRLLPRMRLKRQAAFGK